MGNKSGAELRQEDLFGDQERTGASSLVTVAAVDRPLGAVQRQFNRLTERIRRLRESLAAWEAYISRFQKRLEAELQPIERESRGAQRRLVARLHALLDGPKDGERLSRKHRAHVRSLLLEVIDNLLEDGPDAELETLYNRYSTVSHVERQQQDVEFAETLFGGLFGSETVQGHKARNVEELLRHASEKISDAAAHAHFDKRARRGGAGRGVERKELAAREASASVRDVYRKLVSALHPDRESDTTERERKTDLMQRANQAYERNDLLELLTLQIEIEQIDATALANVPEARLRHYNQVLLEQTKALEAQVAERIVPFRMEFDLTVRDVMPQHVDQALSVRIVQGRAVLDQIERDLKRLDDPRQRRAVLDERVKVEADMPDLEDFDVLGAMLDHTFGSARSVTRRRKRRRRRHRTAGASLL